MKTKDRDHFDTYREQTRIKHIIVEKYIKAYFTILKKNNPNLIYIDGFAGRGTYDDADGSRVYGSPLRALQIISNSVDLSSAVTPVFFEKDDHLAEQLRLSIEHFLLNNAGIRKPILRLGSFNSNLQRIVDSLEEKGKSLAPTFLFADPCGVDGVSFDLLKRFLEYPSCEALIFFNIDGLRRILGLKNPDSKTLITLLGSKVKATELIDLVSRCSTPEDREFAIIDFYLTNLKDHTKAKFVVPFRVEFEAKRTTSHYLLHATSHRYGFRIMKDVMWSVGKREDGDGGLELAQASIKEGQQIFDNQLIKAKSSIIDVLKTENQVKVAFFTKNLVHQAENMFSTVGYREALLKLEEEGKVQVLEKDGSGRLVQKRRRGTLADDYYVGLSKCSVTI